ncbi:hypothetical protein O9909_19045 [Clostridioides difficile]|nr:hypothetical protein [Clostridioides difficile]
MFNKRIKKEIALALTLFMIGFTGMSQVYAEELKENISESKEEVSIQDINSDDKLSSLIENQKEIGIKYQVNKGLTKDEVVERFDKINETYEVGEAFSTEDAEFVLLYSNQGGIKANEIFSNINSRYDYGKPQSFSKQASKFGLDVKISGSVNFDLLGTIKNRYRYSGDYYSKCNNSHLGSINTKITCVAYGVIGQGGVGKVYDGSISGGSRKTPGTLYTDTHKDINVIGHTISYVNVKTDFVTKNGSLLTVTAF